MPQSVKRRGRRRDWRGRTEGGIGRDRSAESRCYGGSGLKQIGMVEETAVCSGWQGTLTAANAEFGYGFTIILFFLYGILQRKILDLNSCFAALLRLVLWSP